MLVFLESIEKDEMTRSDQECIEKSFLTKKSVCVVCRHVANEKRCCLGADVYECEFIFSHLAGSPPGCLFQPFMSF